LTKWSRRHRPIAVTIAASLVVSLILAVMGLSVGIHRIRGEKRRADAQKARADANFRKARDVVDRMFTPAADHLTDTPGTDQVRSNLLQEALKFYQEFLGENGNDPEVRFETARAWMRVGDIYWLTRRGLGQGSQEEPPLRQAIALLVPLVTALPGN